MEKNYSQLLTDIQKKSGISVLTSRDLRFLKEEIDDTLRISLGFNTLRRLFGFLEKTQPSIKTLDMLANYLGFENYSSYKSNMINYDEWYFQQNLQRIQTSNSLTEDDLKMISVSLVNTNNIVSFAYFFSYFIEKLNSNILEIIFKHIYFTKFSKSDLLKFATITTLSLYRIEEKEALTIYKKLIKYDEFRNNMPLLYIDYSTLNGTYSKVLTLIKKQNSNNSDILFVELMEFYRSYYSLKKLHHIEIKKPFNFETFHPVLQGRYYAYLLMRSPKDTKKIEREILNYCKKIPTEITWFLEEIIPSLISIKNFNFLSKLITTFNDIIFETNRWDSKTGHALSLIAMANFNIDKGNTKAAFLNLNRVDLDKIELSYSEYIKLFYYQAKLQISFIDKDLSENTKTGILFTELIQKTGFIKFNEALTEFTYIEKLKNHSSPQ